MYKPNTGITIEKINGEDILKNVLKKLSNLLTSKKSALKKLVDKAEQKFEKFQKTSKTMLTLEDLSFFNMKAPKPVVEMTYSPRFYQPVSYEESGVHIPLEIFDGCKYFGFLWKGTVID